MKQEVLDYVHKLSTEEIVTCDANPTGAVSFKFKAIAQELVINNIYIRVFNANSPVALDVSYQNVILYYFAFCFSFLQYIIPIL